MFGHLKIDPADTAFSIYVRKRDGWKCQRCGHYFVEEERRGLSCSHFIGRANQKTRFEPSNCIALCTGCHGIFETHKATVYRDFMIKRLGKNKFDYLIELSRKSEVVTKEQKKQIAIYYKRLATELPDV